MWYVAQCSGNKPAEIDNTSSQIYVYVRKNFEQTIQNVENEEEPLTIWQYEEQKIRKEDWEVYAAALQNSSDIVDLQSAVDYIAMMSDIEL